MIVYLETLGCSRNQVDSEIMLGRLSAAGHTLTDAPENASAIIINTCGFITSAANEAVDTILALSQYKADGVCQRLIVTGCLAQRYKDDPDLTRDLPEVDAFLGTAACDRIVAAVEGRRQGTLTLFPDPGSRGFQDLSFGRKLSGAPFAYIKVSEGCNRHCTYCIIPALRGRQRSRPIEDICGEAKILLQKGVKELILTAENTTDYGRDSGGGPGFEDVLAALAATARTLNPDAWIRVLYTHPASLSRNIIRTIAAHANICSYYDVPVQHAHDTVLKMMGRPYSRQDLTALFRKIRELDPDAVLRTTVIVGFPGETQDRFDGLMDFIQTVKFDHLGVFAYSDAHDLKSHRLHGHVAEQTAEIRHDTLMAAQAKISFEQNEKHVGKTYAVLVEENPEPGVYIGRTRFQAPEVDGVTFIYSDGLEIGTVVRVQITDAYEYDIAGETV